jgi:Membrane bound O-acyl transferase family
LEIFTDKDQRGPSEKIVGPKDEKSGEKSVTQQSVWDEAYPVGEGSFGRRVNWVLTLVWSFRYTGWKTKADAKAQGLREVQSRTTFIVKNLAIFILCWLWMDTTAYYNRTDPFFNGTSSKLNGPLSVDLENWAARFYLENLMLETNRTKIKYAWFFFENYYEPCVEKCSPFIFFLRQTFRLTIMGTQFTASIALAYSGFTLLFTFMLVPVLPAVWTSPARWPGPFGSLSAIFDAGLQGHWGTFWHQSLRNILLSPGRWFADKIGYTGQDTKRYATMLIVAFVLSAFVHAPVAAYNNRKSEGLSMMKFFWAQGALVLFETQVFDRVLPTTEPEKRKDLSKWFVRFSRYMRITWVAVCVYYTLPFAVTAFQAAGIYEHYPVPISPWHGLKGKGWFVEL